MNPTQIPVLPDEPVPLEEPEMADAERRDSRSRSVVRDGYGVPSGSEITIELQSFEAFVVANSKTLVRCAYLIVGDAGAAQDVTQIALAKVARRWTNVTANGPALPYVRAAVVRTAISWRRRKWHGETPHDILPNGPGIDATSTVDNRDRLRRALAALPRRQRAAVVLRHYLDLDEAATAAALGCSVGTVKSQTAKGLARLRATIDNGATSRSTYNLQQAQPNTHPETGDNDD
ncbi:MAG: polymerase, sigma-24 subunit, subfamily [Ilumatobacteraceae bacterium]|nr:polymerase, sigma-24 subunit, subfamily [Ilumatobacteraceae bacterium]